MTDMSLESVLRRDRWIVLAALTAISALAWADVLITLDRKDFGGLLDGAFYSLRIFKPGSWIASERAAGRLRL